MKKILALLAMPILVITGCEATTPPGTTQSTGRQYTCRLLWETISESTDEREATFAVLDPPGVANLVVTFPARSFTPRERKLAELVDAACTWGESVHETASAAKELVVRFRIAGDYVDAPDLQTWTLVSPAPEAEPTLPPPPSPTSPPPASQPPPGRAQ